MLEDVFYFITIFVDKKTRQSFLILIHDKLMQKGCVLWKLLWNTLSQPKVFLKC